MTEDILEKSLEDLNEQYQKLQEDDYVYIRWINIGIFKNDLMILKEQKMHGKLLFPITLTNL